MEADSEAVEGPPVVYSFVKKSAWDLYKQSRKRVTFESPNEVIHDIHDKRNRTPGDFSLSLGTLKTFLERSASIERTIFSAWPNIPMFTLARGRMAP